MSTDARGPLFADVDADDAAALVAMMGATDDWPAVVAARRWVLDVADVGSSTVVVDVGCGTGAFGADARGRGASTVELDRSAQMLAAVGRRVPPPGALVRGDVTALPLAAAADLVRCERVLQWIDDPTAAIGELTRVTRPGGWLAITDTAWSTFALDHPDPALAAAWSAAALAWVPHPTLALSVPRRLRDLGATDVRVRADVVLVDRWDPDESPGGPPGLPLRDLAAAGRDPAALGADVEVLAALARRDRFTAALTLVTTCARWR